MRSVLETTVSLDPELQILLPNQAPRSWVLIPTSTKRNQGLLKKWLIPGLGQERYKVRLEHLTVSENKGVLKEHSDGGRSKGQRSQIQALSGGQSWNNLSNKILDCKQCIK